MAVASSMNNHGTVRNHPPGESRVSFRATDPFRRFELAAAGTNAAETLWPEALWSIKRVEIRSSIGSPVETISGSKALNSSEKRSC